MEKLHQMIVCEVPATPNVTQQSKALARRCCSIAFVMDFWTPPDFMVNDTQAVPGKKFAGKLNTGENKTAQTEPVGDFRPKVRSIREKKRMRAMNL
jgi:hypothetical protein